MSKRFCSFVAATAAPALLFLSGGTAHANIGVTAGSAPGGVDVFINSWAGDSPPISGWCTYTSVVRGDPFGKPAPVFNVPFYLAPGGSSRLWFPSYPTGSTWDISVTCPGPGGGEARITESTTVVW